MKPAKDMRATPVTSGAGMERFDRSVNPKSQISDPEISTSTPPNGLHPAASFAGGTMNRNRSLLSLAATAVLVAFLCRTTWAEDRDLAFVHILQARGMGDVAADYLQALIKQPDCPAEVKDVFDLEMSSSSKACVQVARTSPTRPTGPRCRPNRKSISTSSLSSNPTIPRAVRKAEKLVVGRDDVRAREGKLDHQPFVEETRSDQNREAH